MPPLTMPKMGDAMEAGTILRWLKKEGETYEEQESIAEIQTEKSTIEVPAYEAGRLVKILVPEGETVPVGTPIADVEPAREPKRRPERPAAPAEAPVRPAPRVEAPLAPVTVPVPPLEGRLPPPPPERVKASPLARKIAAERGIDLARIRGTGPGGRIVESDVYAALAAVPAPAVPAPAVSAPPVPIAVPAPARERPLSPIRRVIARRIAESKRSIPHFYLTLEVDAGPLVAFRKQYNAAVAGEATFNDLIVRACALTLPRYPQLTSQLVREDTVRVFETVHIGIAVALPEGLVVPVIRDCQAKSLRQISLEAGQLAERARAGTLAPDEYAGGTFTVSNLGMYGITLFQAVINPPEASILAVGAIRDEAIVRDGQVAPGKRMSLTLSVDHRLVDGAQAAEFLGEVKRLLENPLALLE